MIIQKKYRKLFREINETGIVPYADIMDQFGMYFEEYKCDVPNLKILSQLNANKVANTFNTMTVGIPVNEFGNGVSIGNFVNVKP